MLEGKDHRQRVDVVNFKIKGWGFCKHACWGWESKDRAIWTWTYNSTNRVTKGQFDDSQRRGDQGGAHGIEERRSPSIEVLLANKITFLAIWMAFGWTLSWTTLFLICQIKSRALEHESSFILRKGEGWMIFLIQSTMDNPSRTFRVSKGYEESLQMTLEEWQKRKRCYQFRLVST